MWIKIKQRLINLDNATDVGLLDNKLTVYYGDSDYWSTHFSTSKEAENVFDFLTQHINAKDVMVYSDMYKEFKNN
jgi:hypothetical protein